MRNTTVIFLTGAATLALEVLASRILTPYFGISLYIWAGILSVTLIALAIGYRIGGVWARKLKGDDASIEALFASVVMPIRWVRSLVLWSVRKWNPKESLTHGFGECSK